MTIEAQDEANRSNPDGPAGGSLMPSDEYNELNQFTEAMRHDLAPEGALEGIFAAEIIRAAWRLRRWANVEDALEAALSDQAADVNRARAETHRILKRSMDELRRLQNERRFRVEVLPAGFNLDDLGLTSYKDLMPAIVTEKRWQLLKRQLESDVSSESGASFERMLAATVGPPRVSQTTLPTKRTQSAPGADSTKRTQSTETGPTKRTHLLPDILPQTPRNAPCPCGSGQKHKRCCGKNAAPLLYPAAA